MCYTAEWHFDVIHEHAAWSTAARSNELTVRRHWRSNHAQWCLVYSCQCSMNAISPRWPSTAILIPGFTVASRAILMLLSVGDALGKSPSKKKKKGKNSLTCCENSGRDSINWRHSYWHLTCFFCGQTHPSVSWLAHFCQTSLLTVILKTFFWGGIRYLSADLGNWCECTIVGSLNWEIMRGILMAVLSCQRGKHLSCVNNHLITSGAVSPIEHETSQPGPRQIRPC